MQKTRPQPGIASQYNLQEYLQILSRHSGEPSEALMRACDTAWQVQALPTDMPGSLDVCLILAELGVDQDTLIVTLLSDSRLNTADFLASIARDYGDHISQMVRSLRWIHDLRFDTATMSAPQQAENLRRMLLSMVEDVRVVLIKLAYRVQRLRMLASAPDDEQRQEIARETLEILAPLANRLGIGQLKWELEDLSFRFLEPLAYKRIAKMLEERREEREQYIRDVVQEVRDMLEEAGIEAEVYGRPKHIYSIWKKMTGKQKDFKELFDVRAIRITLNSLAECYTVLGLVHGKWRHITREFDDYVANPKENGYRSLHTAVFGPAGKPLEIQIRTREMHEFAEYGVAAHWRYKEGSVSDRNLEKSINSLRKLLDPNETRDEELIDSFHTELFPDRVFVLTPRGKVMDLPQGATPLDFAYSVHTEIGHRCRGAKVNGRIVPLTYELQNGETVEVLTGNNAAPSRDWMNANFGFLHTSRARAKVKSWFRQQDHDENVSEGKSLLDREVNKLGLERVNASDLATRFNLHAGEDLYVALGAGDVTTGQLVNALNDLYSPKEAPAPLVARKPTLKKTSSADEVRVRGVGNLLTTIANCCKPMPGDEIVGFITRGQGVTVHRRDCVNIINLDDSQRGRLIETDWGEQTQKTYPVSIHIEAFDRTGLLRDVSKVFADEHVDVIGVNTLSNRDEQTADMTITVELADLSELSRVMDKLNQLQNVIEVSRSKS